MSLQVPPMSYVQTLEQWSPGFWNRFYGAVWAGYNRYQGPMEITSWWRSLDENSLLAGGQPDSQHLVGTALDLVPADPALESAMEMAGFIGVMGARHLHIQAFQAGTLRRVGFLDAVGI